MSTHADPAPSPALESLSLAGLEELYRSSPLGPAPVGVHSGRYLCRVDSVGARRKLFAAADWLLFELPTFGLDFDRRLWWFIHPRLAAGRFDWTPGPSRWRDTETLRVTYKTSRLPRPVRAMLYDEIKPLKGGTCLGIGGMNQERGEGDHFFFSLRPLDRSPQK